MRRFDIRELWLGFKNSGRLHNVLVFLMFVVIATVFWFMMALNDSMQRDFTVNMVIENVPDSVTFINDPPATFHVAVRDRGTTLLRAGGFYNPVMRLNFRDFASNGLFRFTHSDLNASLKATFGKTASILSVSLDSLRLAYTTSPGRQVPVEVAVQAVPFPGYVVTGKLKSDPPRVTLFGPSAVIDTINRVFTETQKRTDLKEPTQVAAAIRQIPGVKVIPSIVNVEVQVEPLVRKETAYTVQTYNVPSDRTLLLFPQKVSVAYYVPMSRFNDEEPNIEVAVDYADAFQAHGGHIPVRLVAVPRQAVHPELLVDSVEYSIVR